MKKTSLLGRLIILFIICIPLVYTAYLYPSLPETIPLHFNIEGKPDGFGNKSKIWWVTLLLTLVSGFVYLIITNLPKIDPKKTARQSPELFHKIATILVIFLSAINLVILFATQKGAFSFGKPILPLLGLLFAVLGNYMHSIKPNYFVGFRTPWALENADNWRKTHQLVGKIWVPGGILLMLASFLFEGKTAIIVFYAIMTILVLVPLLYSYRYYKNHS
ncbi:MAG: SdpI family protein [Bacteroidota bacterium]|nr:SdpI family protein [Bacteroidota bacterium]